MNQWKWESTNHNDKISNIELLIVMLIVIVIKTLMLIEIVIKILTSTRP